MSTEVVVAVVAALAVVTAAVVQGMVQKGRRKTRLGKVTGRIHRPIQGADAGTEVKCEGEIRGLTEGLTAWIVTRVGDLLWPQGGAMSSQPDGRWEHTVHENGKADKIDICLFVTGNKGADSIREWLDKGNQTGDYPGLSHIPDSRQLHCVNGIKVNRG